MKFFLSSLFLFESLTNFLLLLAQFGRDVFFGNGRKLAVAQTTGLHGFNRFEIIANRAHLKISFLAWQFDDFGFAQNHDKASVSAAADE